MRIIIMCKLSMRHVWEYIRGTRACRCMCHAHVCTTQTNTNMRTGPQRCIQTSCTGFAHVQNPERVSRVSCTCGQNTIIRCLPVHREEAGQKRHAGHGANAAARNLIVNAQIYQVSEVGFFGLPAIFVHGQVPYRDIKHM